MNSLKNHEKQSMKEFTSFLDQIYSIIDTRLQYLDYQVAGISATVPNAANTHPHTSSCIFHQDFMYCKIERLSKAKRSLMILRSLVSADSISPVFELFQTSRFNTMEEKEMKAFIDKKNR